jgi:hypothetical protein
MLLPLVSIQKGYEIYAATKDKWISQAALEGREALAALGLKVPQGYERVMRFERGVTTLKVQRIGSFILPRTGDASLQLQGSIDLLLSDLRARPEPKVILQSITALQMPKQVQDTSSETLAAYSLQKGPITRADRMYIADQADGGTPFFAVCENKLPAQTSPMQLEPQCSGYFKMGKVFVEARFSKLAISDWQEHVNSLRVFIDGLAQAQLDQAAK